MTFFANSGVTWPNLEHLTSEAGALSLEAASELLSIVSKLEKEETTENRSKEISATSKKFRDASKLYKSIVTQISVDAEFSYIAQSEMELANVSTYPWISEDLINFPLSTREAYRDISVRLDTLAATITDISFDKQKVDLAPLIFRLMGDWERLSAIARIVAVLNRRTL
ncbi:hypothetical protein ELI43_24380 [Rhizobium leguminosarum]|uniref:hypothetical protein n=1 Tax=Rhizobium leguminosarum TaxID=384 RepID=UPI00102F3E13|nr:hypothetical protein [Rhizobium leguminosarum]TAU55739.1 hypothetical protein ELI43_24380 [Rhizobium leguminosarum]